MQSPNQFDDFRIARRFLSLNRGLQALLLVSLIVGVNLFALKFKVQWDITPDKANSLSPETVAHMQRISGELEIHAVINDQAQLPDGRYLIQDLAPILNQYAHIADRVGLSQFRTGMVHLFRDRDRVAQLKERFRFQEENVILVSAGDRRRVLSMSELYSQNPEAEEWEFRGEQMITAAILEVTDPKGKLIHVTVGHGEMAIGDTDPDRGLSELVAWLDARNIRTAPIDLSSHDRIPDQTDLLLIPSPQAEFRSEDVEKLRQYAERSSGSIVILLEPFRKHNLGELFHDWGILADEAVILDPGPDYQTSSGKLIVRRFAEHPISQSLIDNKLYVFASRPAPVRSDPANPRVPGVQRTSLMATSDTSWMEFSFLQERVPAFTRGRDVPGPIPIAMLAERKGGDTLGLSLRGGRVLVVGDSLILSNELFRLHGNRTFITNIVNWNLQRHHLLSIPPERIRTWRITASESDLQTLLVALMILPASIALLGLFIRVIRR
jgi:hypothetical protein